MSRDQNSADTGSRTNDTGAGSDIVYHHNEAENLPRHSHHDSEILTEENLKSYWRANIKVLITLLSVWAFVSFVCGIILGDWLDQFHLGGFPLGFWFTQQGAMLCFVAIIFIYHFWMLRIERAHGVDDDEDRGVDGRRVDNTVHSSKRDQPSQQRGV